MSLLFAALKRLRCACGHVNRHVSTNASTMAIDKILSTCNERRMWMDKKRVFIESTVEGEEMEMEIAGG